MSEFSPGGLRRFVVWYAAGHVEGYLSVENLKESGLVLKTIKGLGETRLESKFNEQL